MRHEPFAMCLILAGSLAVAAPAGAAGADGIDADMRRLFLLVYFVDGRYDGYMWFSSLRD